MAVSAVGVGLISVVAGLLASYQWDLPSGPAMVVAATLLFAMSLAAGAALARG
jgi:ABC-type Mn2+/Zn2+ transport system permease subunit